MAAALEFRHVDVFTGVPFAGNGLIVLFGNPSGLRADALTAVGDAYDCESVSRRQAA